MRKYVNKLNFFFHSSINTTAIFVKILQVIIKFLSEEEDKQEYKMSINILKIKNLSIKLDFFLR